MKSISKISYRKPLREPDYQYFFFELIKKRGLLLVCLILGVVPMMGAQGCRNNSDDSSFSYEQKAALQNTLNQAITDSNIPGVALAVHEKGGATWMGVSGNATLSTADTPATPMSTDMHTRIGSVTKNFTATLTLLLAEEGKLSLDDTVDLWMGSDYYPNGDTSTIRQLLNMTSGFTSYTATEDFMEQYYYNPAQTLQPEQLVSFARNSDTPNQFAPGEGWNYSNTNYVILGLILEKAGNAKFEDLIKDKIVEPLYLSSTSVPALEDRSIPEKYLHGYEITEDGTWVDMTSYSPSIAFSAGNIISTLPDLLAWIQAVLDKSLLSANSTKQMETFVSMSTGGEWNGIEPGYSLGLTYHNGAIGHNGLINGYQSCTFKYRDCYFAMIINAGSGSIEIEDLFWRAARVLYPE